MQQGRERESDGPLLPVLQMGDDAAGALGVHPDLARLAYLVIGVGLVAVIICLPTFTGFLEQRVSDIVAGAGVLAAAGTSEPADATPEAAAEEVTTANG